MEGTGRMSVKTDGARLWHSLMEMAEIGATEKGGCNRVALTDLDKRGRDLFVGWCEAAGCTVSVDRIGNIFARRPGKNPDAPVVMTGSHLDTQPTGGRFDGVYGVLAGLEVVRTLNDRGIETEAPIEVAVWTNEEGAIFTPMMGSAVYCGIRDLEEVRGWRHPEEGWAVGDRLAEIGYDGDLPMRAYPVAAYFEAHIEQGPVMEINQTTVGVVTASQGQRWYDITVTGQEAHAGPTPMEVRKDPMMGASRIILEIDRIGRSTPDSRGTVGRMYVHPNSPNTIPGQVAFSGDLRHPDGAVLDAMDADFRRSATAIAAEMGLELSIELRNVIPPLRFDPGLVEIVRDAAKRETNAWQDIYTGAGHDACNLALHLPAAMIFVPCEGGISHNEIENAEPEDLEAGCNVLANAMIAAAR
jgi:N-carbamoyl-L-amino-acid hydrolase